MGDRFDEVLAEMRSDRADMRREFASWRAHIDRMQEQTDENLRFLREVNRRGELALRDLVLSQSAMREEIRAETEEIRAQTEKLRAHTQEIHAHTEGFGALTRAIFALAERLESGGGLAPAS